VTQIASKAKTLIQADDLSAVATSKEGVMAVKMGDDNVYVDIAFDEDDAIDMETTVENLNNALNTKGINVTAKYSEFSGGIVLESGQMGESVSFQVAIQAGITEEDIAGGTSFTASYSDPYTGTNAEGTIKKGTETYDIDKSSNTFTVDNVQFTLKGVTSDTSNNSKYITSASITSLLGDYIKTIDTSEPGYTLYELNNAAGNKIKIEDDGTMTIMESNGTTEISADSIELPSADGSTITINKNGTLTTASDNSVKLTGTTDVKGLKDKIVSFVNEYNTLLTSINTKIYEERDTDYLPLTDAQKEEMTDDQIEKWETKAKTGLIRKDSDLERITNAMKRAMSSVMSGSGLCLEKIGIKPVENYAEKNGTYTINEDTLTQALEENSGNVKDLFTRSASTTNTNDKGGIFTQLASTLKSEFKTSTSSLSKKVGLDGTSTQYSNTLTKSIYAKKLLIADLNDLFTDKETALYNKYSALETALQTLNSQQASLSSMLGTS
jgi:flagellar hook-associated protein 2